MNIQMIGQRATHVALAAMPMLACSRDEPQTAFAHSVPSRNVAAIQFSPSVGSVRGALFRLVLAPTGNAARYRVRERLVGHDFPNDAVGETKSIAGTITFDSSGKVIRQESKFVVNAGTFVSDKDRRDGFVRGRLLDAEQYPTIVLVPTDVRGVTLPFPTSGTLPIEMTGDLTVRGVTRPTIWKGTAQFEASRVVGSAATAFTFDDIQIEQPRVPVLLSVADTIRLEISFNLVQQR
ncbi:MAG: YceI family protein [Gemmatimonadota bacterium]|nr:YceI family protein [Gemmatimonadota bacterium]